jgi:cytochrome c553
VDPAKWSIGAREVIVISIAIVVVSEISGLSLFQWAKTHRTFPVESSLFQGAPSLVAWDKSTIAAASDGNPVRGQFIARRCETCHGIEGFSSRPSTPNLAGLDRKYIWKQLDDFRDGKRKSEVMHRIASALSSSDSADVAAYFSVLPNTPDAQFGASFPQSMQDASLADVARRMLSVGDPNRGIPPCQACHGPIGYVRAAPELGSQNSDYVLTQLDDFASKNRMNDIDLPMRTIASQMHEDERRAVAQFYGAGLGRLAVGYSIGK